MLRAVWRRRPSYQRRGRFLRLVVLLASLAAVFVAATWLPVLVLRFVPPVGTSFMAQRLVPCSGIVYYQWVPWDDLSRHTPIAFVAAEDQRFPQHHGFDVEAIRKVLDQADGGKPARGASTISQQVAKNLFLWPGQSWLRKGLEAWWTVLLEVTWPKRRILEVYVNTAQLGPCTFGVGAAARQFFGKDAGALGPSESALLAAVLPSPGRSRVESPSGYVRGRQAWISRQVRSLGGSEYLEAGQ
ncbi:MAG TPA: monofunctional biosynthetic peptidoglycan transglycosylase [Thermoanaerobaculia bacterium]|nr:monofunctional biosynthetic peptidoglycan transglycosylase [Thermoanaerobaculia bacterium]